MAPGCACTEQAEAAAGNLAQSKVPNLVESKRGHWVNLRRKTGVCSALGVEKAGIPDPVPKIESVDCYVIKYNIAVITSL